MAACARREAAAPQAVSNGHPVRGAAQPAVPRNKIKEATVFSPRAGEKAAAMFRPDPNGVHSREEIIAKLSEVLREVPADSPRAERLAEMIRELREAAVEGSR